MSGRRESYERSIGEEVTPPSRSWKPRNMYYTGISKRDILRTILKRAFWIIPLFFFIFLFVTALIFSPVIISALTSDPIKWSVVLFSMFPMLIFIPIILIAMPIGLILGYKMVSSSISDNRIEITDEALTVNVRISNMVSPRRFTVPLNNIREVFHPDREYFDTRKEETRWFHRVSNHPFKPRIGDYYNIYSRQENILIIKLARPMWVPYFDYVWTASEVHSKGKNVEEIVVDVENTRHREFRNEVEGISRSLFRRSGI